MAAVSFAAEYPPLLRGIWVPDSYNSEFAPARKLQKSTGDPFRLPVLSPRFHLCPYPGTGGLWQGYDGISLPRRG